MRTLKTVLILIAIFSFMAVSSCTNDEGEQDIEIITPEEETQEAN